MAGIHAAVIEAQEQSHIATAAIEDTHSTLQSHIKTLATTAHASPPFHPIESETSNLHSYASCMHAPAIHGKVMAWNNEKSR
jgi:hypothetical protein